MPHQTPQALPLAPEHKVAPLVEALLGRAAWTEDELSKLFRKHPWDPGRLFRKSDVIRAIRTLGPDRGWPVERLVQRLRMKPVRSQSGVLAVTVLTKPFPCPGRCVFCPNDVRMPKSYLSGEPGALRAAMFRFDPFAQVTGRLFALAQNGHPVDKIELIVLGGTWTHYPRSYRLGFIHRCFEAMNAFDPGAEFPQFQLPPVDYEALPAQVNGRTDPAYNVTIQRFWRNQSEGPLEPCAEWEDLEEVFRENQDARCRNVGLSIETRPDELSLETVRELRMMGATKVQIGIQSLDDAVLQQNKRGHTVATTKLAVRRLKSAGFKVQGHWMANLVGANVESDKADYLRLFSDPDIQPDELKLYPTSLIESAELMVVHQQGGWRPYSDDELLEVVSFGLSHTPRTCRLSRVIRDIPGTDIVVGNKEPNFRERAERALSEAGKPVVDIRAREIRGEAIVLDALRLVSTEFESSVGIDRFLELVQPDGKGQERIAGFLRLTLPDGRIEAPFAELKGAALVREVHVYGPVAMLQSRRQESEEGLPQHRGLGQWLLAEAESQAAEAGFGRIAVISAVGTRRYYEKRGFWAEGHYHVKRLISGS